MKPFLKTTWKIKLIYVLLEEQSVWNYEYKQNNKKRLGFFNNEGKKYFITADLRING
jgi:hypothetical protein